MSPRRGLVRPRSAACARDQIDPQRSGRPLSSRYSAPADYPTTSRSTTTTPRSPPFPPPSSSRRRPASARTFSSSATSLEPVSPPPLSTEPPADATPKGKQVWTAPPASKPAWGLEKKATPRSSRAPSPRLRAPPRRRETYGFDKHNFWYFMEGGEGRHPFPRQGKGRATAAGGGGEKDPQSGHRSPQDPEKRSRVVKSFLERNYHRIWRLDFSLRCKTQAQIHDYLVNHLHFDAVMSSLLKKEETYRYKSSERLAALLTFPLAKDEPHFTQHDPYLASLTTSREAKRARQERLFLPTYTTRVVDHCRVKGREPEYGCLALYCNNLQRNKHTLLNR